MYVVEYRVSTDPLVPPPLMRSAVPLNVAVVEEGTPSKRVVTIRHERLESRGVVRWWTSTRYTVPAASAASRTNGGAVVAQST